MFFIYLSRTKYHLHDNNMIPGSPDPYSHAWKRLYKILYKTAVIYEHKHNNESKYCDTKNDLAVIILS